MHKDTEQSKDGASKKLSKVWNDMQKVELLKPGACWYIVSRQWYDNFNKLRLDTQQLNQNGTPKLNDESFCIPDELLSETINNDHLIHKTLDTKGIQGLYDIVLKPNVSDPEDFVLLSGKIYDVFREHFTSTQDIKRHVIADGVNKTYNRVEIFPLHLFILQLDCGNTPTDNVTEVCVSKKTTVGDFNLMLKQLLCLEHITATRLWSYPRESGKATLMTSSHTLEQELISQQDQIIMECEQEGSWPLDQRIKSSKSDIVEDSNYSYPTIVNEGEKKNKKTNSLDTFDMDSMKIKLGGYGSSTRRKGLCGLKNLGNTCFMNSALQCLSNTPQLNSYFITDRYIEHVNETNALGMKGELAVKFGSLIKEMWSGINSCSPVNLKHCIGQFAPQFSGYSQHDSQEFLAFLLDGLHEDLNQVKKKPYVEMKDEVVKRPDAVVAKEQWEMHLARNRSVIVDSFQGQLKSTLECPECKKISIKFDPFMYLSLPIPKSSSQPLIDVLMLPCEGNARPVKYCVELTLNTTVEMLKKRFLELSLIDATEQDIVVADMSGHRIFNIAQPQTLVNQFNTRDKCLLFIPNQKYDHSIFVTQWKKVDEQLTSCGLPFVIFTLSEVTNRQVWLKVWKSIRKDIILQIEAETDDVALTDDDTFQNDIKVFRIRVAKTTNDFSCVNDDCQDKKCKGCPLPLNDDPFQHFNHDTTLIVEWLDLNCYNSRQAMTVVVHQSVNSVKENAKRFGVDLHDCLNLFSETEQLGPKDPWYCPNCKEMRQAHKRFEIWSAPDILIVHLKRFTSARRFVGKIDCNVDFPIHDLDLSPFMVRRPSVPMLYDLYAISNHMGGLGGGHYTAYCKNYIDGGWYLFNDSSVSQCVDEKKLKGNHAYVLFYKRKKIEKSHPNVTTSPTVIFN
ncbi:ubiquitin carboxyl-terminal hydrolase [Acrasis kona]|uniref:Ubiquitin carboxyl-terminal hydrolase n=1 Tax=Acrasis kona TaxID=1008807 RepID=A0AAW2YUT8_9EUKA